jgi:hypothetical protein
MGEIPCRSKGNKEIFSGVRPGMHTGARLTATVLRKLNEFFGAGVRVAFDRCSFDGCIGVRG